MEYIIIYLDAIENRRYTKDEERIIKWLKFIKTDNLEEIIKMRKGDKIMEQTLEYLNEWFNDEEQDIYRNNIFLKAQKDGEIKGEKIGEKIGEKRGEKKGERKSKIDVAKKLLLKGMSIDDIKDVTGLTAKQIEKLMEKC